MIKDERNIQLGDRISVELVVISINIDDTVTACRISEDGLHCEFHSIKVEKWENLSAQGEAMAKMHETNHPDYIEKAIEEGLS
jgi:hypothetical protein